MQMSQMVQSLLGQHRSAEFENSRITVPNKTIAESVALALGSLTEPNVDVIHAVALSNLTYHDAQWHGVLEWILLIGDDYVHLTVEIVQRNKDARFLVKHAMWPVRTVYEVAVELEQGHTIEAFMDRIKMTVKFEDRSDLVLTATSKAEIAALLSFRKALIGCRET